MGRISRTPSANRCVYGTPIDENFAIGLQGAESQAIAPNGSFQGNLFVACGNRVMEVDIGTGQASEFISCVEAHGITFDPEGYMHVSAPSQDQILRVGPNLPGDMNGSGVTDFQDMPGFVLALLRAPDAPLPIITADMSGDGCANGGDVQVFVDVIAG